MQSYSQEKRQYPRIETSNLVSYVLYNDKGTKVDSEKGHTLNLSQGGVLLETDKALEGIFIILMTIDIEGKKIKIKGKVAHTRNDAATSHYLSGIKFTGPEDKQLDAIIAFVKSINTANTRLNKNGRRVRDNRNAKI